MQERTVGICRLNDQIGRTGVEDQRYRGMASIVVHKVDVKKERTESLA